MTGALEILIIDDDVIDRQAVKRHLNSVSFETVIHEAKTAREGHTLIQNTAIDCVLLDYRLPDANGIDFMQGLGAGVLENSPAIVMLTGSGSESVAVEAMKSGVHDYLIKEELTPESLQRAIKNAIDITDRQREAGENSRRMKELALVDTLTQIGNRNFFEMRIEHALKRARRQSALVCLLMMDLNGFKSINDTHGHLAGDQVLQEVGRRLKLAARDSDTVARLGGDEFVLIMETGVSAMGAEFLASRIREMLLLPICIDAGEVSIGVSVGIAHFPADGDESVSLIGAADAAMYRVKRG